MQLPSSSLASLLLFTSPLLASAQRPPTDPPTEPPRARGLPSATPILTWLQESAARIVLGRPSRPGDEEEPSLIPADVYHSFHRDIVVRFNLTTVEEERALANAVEHTKTDVWAWGPTFDFRIPKDALQPLLERLPKSLREGHSVMIADLPSSILESNPPAEEDSPGVVQTSPSSPGHGDEGLYFFRNYQPHNVVVRWMGLIEVMFPALVRYTTVGKSYEGRDIPALVVGGERGSRDPSVPRKTLVVMGGSHAREWISTTTVNYLAWAFVTSYGKDQLVTRLLHEFDIVFVPEMNPDGIDYTWTGDRLWRKSRQPSEPAPRCLGLDLDHAFGYEWAGRRGGRADDPCSESYAGHAPWESVEAAALRDWATRAAGAGRAAFVGLVDLHAYSQQVLFPYAYTCAVAPPNREKMEELALGLAKSIRLFSGEAYAVKPACQGAVPGTRRGPAGGSAIDWFYHELGAHYSYQIKLRDTGSYGFLLPPDQIIPTGEEILQAMRYLGDYLLGNDGIENARVDGVADTNEGAPAVPEEDEEQMELRKR